MKVGDFMTTRIHTVSSGRSVRTVADRMEQLKTGCLLVEENGEILGILTSRDVRSSHPNRIAADVMTSRIISVTTEDFIWDALNLMKNHHIERLVVTEGEQVRGIVTRESLSAALNRFIDPLTGLYRAEYIRHLTDHFLNLKKTFQFLFLDLDNFGEINKQFGHPVGDDFICRFAERLTGHQRDGVDFICRYAGDEFIFLTLRGKEETLQLAEKLSSPVVIDEIELRASVGIFHVSLDDDYHALTFREILQRSSLMCTDTKQRIS